MQTFFTTLFGLLALGTALFFAFGCGVQMGLHKEPAPAPDRALVAMGFSGLFSAAAVVLLLVRP